MEKTILVVDDSADNLDVASRAVRLLGYQTISARNGQEAINQCQEQWPDMILMDVMMPGMDGFEATRRIRALDPLHWVPIIMLTALDQMQFVSKGFESGADDYLFKPINFTLLKAKIDAFFRIAGLQQRIAEKSVELEEYYRRTEDEQRISRHVLDCIAGYEGLRDPWLRFELKPANHFSGDLIAAARTPRGALHIMLADAAGHGLSAALTSLPLIYIFNSMSEKGHSLPSIAAHLNKTIHELFPIDRFIAATLVSVDQVNRAIEVWNGGNPEPMFVDEQGQVRRIWESRYVPLGIKSPEHFVARTDVFRYESGGQFFVCSDGLVDAEDEHGKPFGWDRLSRLIAGTKPEDRFDGILETIRDHLGDRPSQDDISIVMVNVPTETEYAASSPVPAFASDADAPQSSWKFSLTFGPRDLARMDVIPLLADILNKVPYVQPRLNEIYTILSELFANALEHGLLRMDSAMKGEPGGFEAYYAERDRRLAALDQGTVDFSMEMVNIKNQPKLRICVRDSGPGFDHHSASAGNFPVKDKWAGRGIPLIRTISDHVRYIGCGNEVEVICSL